MNQKHSLGTIVSRGTAWTSLGNIFSRIVGLGSMFIILQNLAVGEYGLAELVLSTLPLLSIFLLPGLNTVVVADMGIAHGEGKLGRAKGILWSYFNMQLFFAIIGWSILFFGAELVAKFEHNTAATFLRVASFALLSSPFRNFIQVVMRVKLRFRLLSFYAVLEECIKVVLLAIGFYFFDFRVGALIGAVVLTDYIGMLLIFPWFLRAYKTYQKVEREHFSFFHLLLAHGKWSIITTYANTFGQNIRLWLIEFFLGLEMVGLYALASGLYRHLVSTFPFHAVLQPILPQFAHDKNRLRDITKRTFKYSLWSFLLLGIGGVIVVPVAIPILFPKYAESVPLFLLLLPALIPTSIAAVFTPLFQAFQAQRELFTATIYKTFAIIIFGALFYPLIRKGLAPEFLLALEFLLTNVVFIWVRAGTVGRYLPNAFPTWRAYFSFTREDRVALHSLTQGFRLGTKSPVSPLT